MSAQDDIKAILSNMFLAWNSDDKAGYLAHYWKSEEMRWSVKGAWYKGWASMEREYSRDFPAGSMGDARIFDVDVMMAGEDVGIAYYCWEHVFPSERLAGSATQVFRKIEGRWQIIHENVARVPQC